MQMHARALSVVVSVLTLAAATSLALTLDDGTRYAGADGGLTLLGNLERAVVVSAQTACAPFAAGALALAPNLQAGFRGVDLGANDGLQFVPSAGGALDVPVLVNAVGVRLTSFEIVVGCVDACAPGPPFCTYWMHV